MIWNILTLCLLFVLMAVPVSASLEDELPGSIEPPPQMRPDYYFIYCIPTSSKAALDAIDPDAVDPLMELVKLLEGENGHLRRSASVALTEAGRDAIPYLVELFIYQPLDVRKLAITAVGDMGPDGETATHELIRLLYDEDYSIRRLAIDALGNIGPGAGIAIPHLVVSMKNADINISRAAGEALGKIGKAAIPEVLKALESGNPDLQSAAALAVYHIGPAAMDAAPYIVAMLSESKDRVHGPALKAAGSLGYHAKDAVPSLVDMLGKFNAEHVPWALSCIGPDALPHLIQALQVDDTKVRRAALSAIIQMGPYAADSVPVLISLLKDDNANIRTSAIIALGNIGPTASYAVPALLQAPFINSPTHSDSHLFRDVGITIGKIGADALPYLCAAMDDIDPSLRRMATYALGYTGWDAVPYLIEALGDPDNDVRTMAASSLAFIGPSARDAIPALVETIGDPHVYAARTAVFALGEIGPLAVDTLPKLREVAKSHRFGIVQSYAETAIKKIEGDPNVHQISQRPYRDYWAKVTRNFSYYSWKAENDPAFLPLVIKALGDSDPLERAESARILHFIGKGARKALPYLRNNLDDEDIDSRSWAGIAIANIDPESKDVIPVILEALGSDNPELSIAAGHAINLFDSIPQCHAGTLIAAAFDVSPSPLFGILEPLMSLGPDRGAAIPAITEALETGDETEILKILEILRSYGPDAVDAVPAVTALIGHEQNEISRVAICVLERIGYVDDMALEALGEALHIKHYSVRRTAADTLAGFGDEGIEALVDSYRTLPVNMDQTPRLALVSVGSPAIPALVAVLDDEDSCVRYRAAKTLDSILPGIGDKKLSVLIENIDPADLKALVKDILCSPHSSDPLIVLQAKHSGEDRKPD